jgi:restriction system protein
VVFQCKRYRRNVSSKEIREFRGSMTGRTERGLFITTSDFTREAKLEAMRDGTVTIDLIDGDLLMEKMRELGLGLKTERQEITAVVDGFFESF